VVTLTATPGVDSVFTGWSGAGCSGTGTCTVTVTAATVVTATFAIDPPLTVTLAGAGTVTSNPAGIDCGATCAASYASGTVVTLTATPNAGSVFTGWSGGGCTGTGTCTVTMTAATAVTATFTPTYMLTLATAGAGSGTASGAGTYTAGTAVQISATPAVNSAFVGWSGTGCPTGATSPATVVVNGNTTCTATFALIQYTLTLATAGAGSGTTSGAGTYPAGTLVQISATPAVNSAFGGWSGIGCPTGAASPATIVVNGNTTCTATFAPHPPFLSDSSVYAVPVVPRPPLGVATPDPTFGGSLVTRITDPSMIPIDPTGTFPVRGLVHEYSRYAGLNADGTLLLAQAIGGASSGQWALIDLATGQVRMWVPTGGDPEFSWHPTDPTRALFRANNSIRVLHADTLTVESLMTFSQYGFIETKEEGRPSDDWHYFAFKGYHYNIDGSCCDWSAVDLVVADLFARTIVSTWTPPIVPDMVGMSPSGNYVVGTFSDYTKVFDRNLAFLKDLHPGVARADLAYDAAGNEVYVYVPQTAAQTGEFGSKTGVASVRLDPTCTTQPECKQLVLETGYGLVAHVSGIPSRAHPGWVLLSTYMQPGDPQQPFGREIFLLSLDGTQSVKRIAHHHSDVQPAGPQGDEDYFAEPHATMTWDGNTIVFSSTWGDPLIRYDVYTVTQPPNGTWWP
jgi:hypothetical protein